MFDIETLPQNLAGDFRHARASTDKLSVEARSEICEKRKVSLRTQQRSRWGEGAVAAVRVGTGELADGDVRQDTTSTPLLEVLATKLSGSKVVQGYGSVFDLGYVLYDAYGPYIEYMNPHAFDKSLAVPDIQVSFLSSHSGLGMATTRGGSLALGADTFGLGFAASLSAKETDAKDIYNKLERGSTPLDTSVAGIITAYEWNLYYDEIEIYNWNMSRGEISIVQAGANPAGWVSPRKDNTEATRSALAEMEQLTNYQEGVK